MEKITAKTVELEGAEMKVDGLCGQNTAIINHSGEKLYASAFPNIKAGADNVIEIPAGTRDGLNGTHGTVYLLGSGRVELRGTDYAVNFRMPSSSTSGGGGGGGTSDVTKAYVDAQDSTNLGVAKAYTDAAIKEIKEDVSDNADNISALQADMTAAQSTISANAVAISAADSKADAAQTTAEAAQATAETNAAGIDALETSKADKSEIPTSLPANGGNADTVGGFTVGCDVPEDAVFTDTVVDISGKMDKSNPTGSGAVSINRKSGTEVGYRSVAMGSENEASAYYAVAIGDANVAANNFSIALGTANQTNGVAATAIGDMNEAGGPAAVALGSHCEASGAASTALGSTCTASADGATASGYLNAASGYCSTAIGQSNVASNANAVALGYGNEASGDCAVALGNSNLASGDFSFAEGNSTEATHIYSQAMGKETKTGRNFQLVIGGWNAVRESAMFVIGCGYPEQPITVFRVDETGDTYAIGAYQTGGADYAEYIKPWHDDNPNDEDRRGYFVTVKNGLLYKANPGDYIVGITSGNPSVVGNGDEDWLGRWQRDEFGELIYEDVEVDDFSYSVDDNGNKLAIKSGSHIEKRKVQVENYDPNQKYIERKKRPEWDYVGMIGVLPLRDDGTCAAGGFAKCGAGGIATAADEWECHKTFFVIERVNENVIKVEMR